jgi:hypothetical protein
VALRRRTDISFLPAGLKLNIDFSAAGLTLEPPASRLEP